MNNTVRIAFSVLLIAGVAACAKKKIKPEPVDTNQQTTETHAADTTGRYTRDSLDTDSCLRQRVVYFDLDQTMIKPEFQAQIACHAAYLRQFPEARVRLEGNADERGSREYNLGLGERRGNAVSGAIQGNGGGAAQMSVVSYGEERPVCSDSSEDCWQKNRRVEIVYTVK